MTLELYNEVYIVQNDIRVVISNETLPLETNGDRSTVHYELTTEPGYGQLMIDYIPVTTFSQADVDAGRLFYFQSNLSSAYDEFTLGVRDSVKNEIEGVLVAVIVEPLVRTRDDPVSVDSDGPFHITLDYLDASRLATETNSDPVYEVFILPRLGTLGVIAGRRRNDSVRAKRDLDHEFFEPKLTFSHDDIVNEQVTYTPSPGASSSDGGPQSDAFNYTLRALYAQPAVGSLKFTVTLPRATTAAPIVDGRVDDDYNYVYIEVDEDDGQDGSAVYVTTALIVAGGVLTSICSIVSYRCYRLSRRRRWKRRQRELDALRQDDKPSETVERHAVDLHPSEPLLTRSAWTEPIHVAASEGELRRIRAQHWLTERHSRPRALNEALRCAGVDSAADDQTSPTGRPHDDDDQQPYPHDDQPYPRESVYRGPPASRPYEDVTSPTTWFDSFGATQPSWKTGQQPASTGLTDPQNGEQPGRTDTLLPWFDHSQRLPRSTQSTLSSQSRPTPGNRVGTERHSTDQQMDRARPQQQDPDHQLAKHSSYLVSRPVPILALPADRLTGPGTDVAHSDPVHQGDVSSTPGPAISPARTSRPDDATYPAHSRGDQAAQQIVYDWENVDPKLLDLCRKTSPVLDKNEHWV